MVATAARWPRKVVRSTLSICLVELMQPSAHAVSGGAAAPRDPMVEAFRCLRPARDNARILAWTVGLSLLLLSPRVAQAQGIAPQLNSATLTSGSILSAGSNLTYAFAVTPGTDQLVTLTIDVEDPNQQIYHINGDIFPFGIYTLPIIYQTSGVWVNGAYTVVGVTIYSSGENSESTTYYPLGGTVTNSTGETVVATNPLTSALNFTLTGGVDSVTGPTVTSFTPLRGNPILAIGSTLAFNLGLSLGTRGEVTQLDLLVQDPLGGQENLRAVGNLTGPLVYFPLNTTTLTGAYTVLGLTISDGYGTETFSAASGPSGTFETSGAATMDFSSLGFSLIAAPGDINNDGMPDIFWTNTTTGERGAYLMNGPAVTGWIGVAGWVSLGAVPTEWRIAAVADFTGSGQNDILWQNTATGQCGFYLMNGTTVTGWADLGTFPLEWKIVAAGDFEGNGNNDIVWQNTSTGECGFYLMNGLSVTGWAELGTVPTQWQIKAASDFNNDGQPDILWQNSMTGEVGIYLMNGTAVTGWASVGTPPAGWEVAGAGYLSGNGNSDIIWQNTSTGERGFYLMNGTTVTGWGDMDSVQTLWQIQE
jgi:hypothetical protein